LPANNRECVSRRLERYDEGGARRGDVETRLGVATQAVRPGWLSWLSGLLYLVHYYYVLLGHGATGRLGCLGLDETLMTWTLPAIC
jgi:hypothetical protein